MNNFKSNDLSGDLNFIVTEYLSKIASLQPAQKNKLIQELKENLNFGDVYDIDLNVNECNYEIRKEIYNRMENRQLNDIYSNFISFLTKSKGEEADYKEKPNLEGEENSEKLIFPGREEAKKANTFAMMKGLKERGRVGQERREDLEKEKIRSFKHMKSLLGHISVADENMINPVPIYCISFSNDNNLIFTGDNNGLIKIWSSRTGALVEILKSHEKAINDILLVDSFLISCSEDMSVKIWDINKLSLLKTINFDESIIRVISYQFKKDHDIIIASSFSGKIFLFDLKEVVKLTQKAGTPPEYENETFVSKVYFDKNILEKYNLKKIKNNIQQSCMAAHNKSGILVCGFNEGLICVWDLQKILEVVIEKRRFIHEFEKYVLFLEYVHSSIVQISEFNKIGNYFITASVDGLVLVWEVKENVIAMIRSHQANQGLYPIYSIFKLTEGENKMRCSVNAATWSSNNNYVIAMISSRNKKRGHIQNLNQNENNILADHNPNDINVAMLSHSGNNPLMSNMTNNSNQIQIDSRSSNTYKRSSAILVYDIHSNKLIRRFDSDNGFSLHDECYVLESHPIREEVILTVTNSNEIILFDFLTREILCKFIEENYFFNNISNSMLATEGKFSSNGDSFVISTYLGSISIYNIYSKNSFSTTYMNQFFNEEFNENATTDVRDENNFVSNVNMHNLPYISQQPYSQFKLKQLEDHIFPKLTKNYNYSSKEIQHKLMNNYECYEKNNEERQFECEREEKIFIQAAKENLTYMIPENVVDEIESEEAYSEYNMENVSENEEVDNENRREDLEMEDLEALTEDNMIVEINNQNSEAVYNLRSRRTNLNNISTNRNRLRWRLRNRNQTEEINQADNEEFVINQNSIDNLGRRPTRRGRKKLRKRNNLRRRKDDDDDADAFDSESEAEINSEEEEQYSVKSDSFSEKENQSENEEANEDIAKYGKDIASLIKNCKEIDSYCFLCKFYSKSLIGPFVTENYRDFNLVKEINVNTEYEQFYFHVDCLLTFNDFVITENNKNNKVNLSETIRNVIIKEEKCWRCLNTNATKKCFDCNKYFHGHLCLNMYCVEMDQGKISCLECYRKNLKDTSKSHLQLKYNEISREFFNPQKVSFYTYYPQLGDKVYFVLQAYEELLKAYFDIIIMEVDEVFFWKSEDTEDNINIAEEFNYRTPFLCEIIKMEFAFPSLSTINLLKKLYKNKANFQDKLNILIKMKLKIISSGNDKVFDIVIFKNESPDFLVHQHNYENNYKLYQDLEKINNVQQQKNVKVVIADENYDAALEKIELRENNEAYKNSPFETILVQFMENNNSESKEPLRVSFWDLYNPELDPDNILDPRMKNLESHLHSFIDDIINKNKNKFYPFLEEVDEVKDQAEGYYEMIPVPMSLNLIKNRLTNYYYLTTQSIEFDVELILLNAGIFNPENSKIVKCAQDLVKEIKIAVNICKGNYFSSNNINNLNSGNDFNSNRKLTRLRKQIDTPVVEISPVNDRKNLRSRRQLENYMNNTGGSHLTSTSKTSVNKRDVNSPWVEGKSFRLDSNEEESEENKDEEDFNYPNSMIIGNYSLRRKRARAASNTKIKIKY